MGRLFCSIVVGLMVFTTCKSDKTGIVGNKDSKLVTRPFKVDIEEYKNNIRPITLSEIGKDLIYIPLETNSQSLLRNINRLAFSDKFIFVCDFDKLIQFDEKGNFIRQIGSNGRGPGEYIHVSFFDIDEKSERIYILAWGIHTILEYDFNGKFIRSFEISFPTLQFIKTESNSFAFVIPNHSSNPDAEYSEIITDSLGTVKTKIKNHNRFQTNSFTTVIPLYYFNDTIRILESRVDTLSILGKENRIPYAIFNFGKEKMETEQYEINAFKEKNIDKLWIWNICENNDYLFLHFLMGLGDSSRFCIFNKHTSETVFLNEDGFIDNLDNGNHFWPKYVYNDSILVDYQGANQFLKAINNKQVTGSLEALGRKLTELSNPILIVLK
jgi:hypothetical protein